MNSKTLQERHEKLLKKEDKPFELIVTTLEKKERELKNGHIETYFEENKVNMTKKVQEESTTLKIDELIDLRDKLEV